MVNVPPLVVIGNCLVCLGELLHVVGTSTTHWIQSGYKNEGLFKYCSRDDCIDITDIPTELKAVQAMIILALLSGIVGSAVAVAILIGKANSRPVSKLLFFACAGACVGAFVFMIIGIVVYVKKIYDPLSDLVSLGYSFALCIAGGVLMLTGGIPFLAGGTTASHQGQYAVLTGNK